MNRRELVVGGVLASLGAGLFSALGGCGTLWLNLTKERVGNITMVFINTTLYRASFSFGTYDAWNRSPGPINFEQWAVAPNTTEGPKTLSCARNAAIGTQDLVDRVIATEIDLTDAGFNPDMFDTVVHFSGAPSDSDAAHLPIEGTALGIEVLLGIDFSCGDQLVFTFVEDPDAEGGFRIDFEVIPDEVDQD